MDWIDATVEAGMDPRDLPEEVCGLLKMVFALGRIDGEVGMSGAAAEAAKDCRAEGLHDAADLIDARTVPETLKIQRENAEAYLKEAQTNDQ